MAQKVHGKHKTAYYLVALLFSLAVTIASIMYLHLAMESTLRRFLAVMALITNIAVMCLMSRSMCVSDKEEEV